MKKPQKSKVSQEYKPKFNEPDISEFRKSNNEPIPIASKNPEIPHIDKPINPKPIEPKPVEPIKPKPIEPKPTPKPVIIDPEVSYEPYLPGILKPKILSDYFPDLPIDLDRLNKTDLENIKKKYRKLRLVLLLRIESDIRYIEDYQSKIDKYTIKDEMLELYESRLKAFKTYLKEDVKKAEEAIKRDGDLAIDYKFQY